MKKFTPYSIEYRVDSRSVGQEYEKRACEWFLRQKNATLIANHYWWRQGEIDLIFEETTLDSRTELVFVEVRSSRSSIKTGSSSNFNNTTTNPKELYSGEISKVGTVGTLKRLRLLKTIRRFLTHYQGKATETRFDLLVWENESWRHFENIWLMS